MQQNTNELPYSFYPSDIASNFVPLVVIFDDIFDADLKEFHYKMWNILIIHNSFQEMHECIASIVLECECEDHIYFFSSAANVNEALHQAQLIEANALFANMQGKNLDLHRTDEHLPLLYLCNCPNIDAIKQAVEFCPHEKEKINALKEVLDFFEKMISQ